MTAPARPLPPIVPFRDRAPRRIRGIGSLVRWVKALIPRAPTLEERREEAARKAQELSQRKAQEALRSEAERAAPVIIDVLTGLDVCYRSRETGTRKVKLKRPFGLCEDALIFPIDLSGRARPRGVGIAQLENPEIVRNLAGALGRQVEFKFSELTGPMYVVYRREGANELPVHVKFDDVLTARPATSDALSIPIGVGPGGKVIWRSLGSMVSMMVAGTTGAGKSNFLRSMVSVLATHNSPKRLKLAFIDLKELVEFYIYRDLPHVLRIGDQPALVGHRDGVLPLLEYIVGEGERRLRLLKSAGVVNVREYNAKRSTNALPYIVIVVDELADIKLDPRISGPALEALINVASRFRAAGLSLITCTQYPKSEVVPMRLKAVMPAKLAFGMPNMTASVMVLNNGSAFGLKEKGRAIFQWNAENVAVQTAYISNDKANEIVGAILAGRDYASDIHSRASTHDVTREELLEWAINENAGKLGYDAIYNKFRGRGMTVRAGIAMALDMVGQVVPIGAAFYRVDRPTRTGGSITLVRVDGPDEADAGPLTDHITLANAEEFADTATNSNADDAPDTPHVETVQ